MKSVELIIKGRKVIDVGYRPFLLLNAMKQGIQKIYAFNSRAEGKEIVVVQVQGEDDIVTYYVGFVRSEYPPHAEVEEIAEKDFQGQVEDAYKFAQILQFEQIAKVVPVIIGLDKKQDIMIDKQDIMIEKQDIMIGKQETTIGVLRKVKEDTSAIKDDISVLRKDTSESLYEKYEELCREIAEIKATLSEIKAKVA